MVTVQDYASLSLDVYNSESTTEKPVNMVEWGRVHIPYNSADSDFYAAAYVNTSNGEIVIAYRGTDSTSELATDTLLVGTGAQALQIWDAYNFYLAVKQYYPSSEISFTGHSLGGALAGVMSAYTGLNATVFAPVPYRGAYELIQNGHNFTEIKNILGFSYIVEYGTIPPSQNTNGFENIESHHIEGEVAELLRGSEYNNSIEHESDDKLWSTQKHSAALHSIVLYGETIEGPSREQNKWREVDSFLSELFNNDIAKSIGYSKASYMMSDIALTTEQEHRIIDGLFNDVGKIGAANLSKDKGGVSDPAIQKSIVQLAIQYAGQLAKLNTDHEPNNDVTDTDGVLIEKNGTIFSELNTGENTPWRNTERIFGKEKLFDYIQNGDRGGFLGPQDASIKTILNEVEYLHIEANKGTATTIQGFQSEDGKEDHNDLIIGGNGNDTFFSYGGNDVVLGGKGDDTFYGSSGNNIYEGGGPGNAASSDKNDTANYILLSEGITITFKGGLINSSRSDIEVNKGNEELDKLFEINNIIATDNKDILKFDSLNPYHLNSKNQIGRTGYINMEGGLDTVDLQHTPDLFPSSDAYVVLLGNSTNEKKAGIYHKSGDKTKLLYEIRNAEKVLGTVKTDYLYGSTNKDSISQLHGNGGVDALIAGSGETHLYGGADEDVYSLSHNTWVEESEAKDVTIWGGFHLTGGTQQRWMESGYAYSMPFSSIVSSLLPPTSAAAFIETSLGLLLDLQMMPLVRYGLTDSNQLLIQMGKVGTERETLEAVINDYTMDIDTGKGSAGIAVYKHIFTENATLADMINHLNLASYAAFGFGLPGRDPLIIDLDGDGLELSSQGAQSVYFDVDGDGFAERTGWVRPDDGLLARDLDGNGKIDDITELFGNPDVPGFDMLSELDSNGDGIISAADEAFSELLVWQDLDRDGETDEGELKTLDEHGIAEISLETRTPSDDFLFANDLRREATITRTDGAETSIFDVALNASDTDTVYLGDTTVSAEAAALSNLKGFGEMPSLAIVMTNDAQLLSMVESFETLPSETSWTDLKTATTDILFRWAGVDTVPATAMGESFDEQKLEFLEKYFGSEMAARDEFGVPTLDSLEELQASWDSVVAKTTLRLAVQGPLSDVVAGVEYDSSTDRLNALDTVTLTNVYETALSTLATDPVEALAQWQTHWGPMLAELGNSLFRSDGVEVRVDYAVAALVAALETVSSPIELNDLVDGLGITNIHLGTSGEDSLTRVSDARTVIFVGSEGNDTLSGGINQDVYVFGSDFGQDVVIDADPTGKENGDRLRFATLTADDVSIVREGDDLVVYVTGTTDKVTVKNQYKDYTVALSGVRNDESWGIEDIQFADGTIYEAIEIAAATGLGTDQNDILHGSMHMDHLDGLAGDDELYGGDHGDFYYYGPGDGNDTIHDVMTNPLISAPDILMLLGGFSQNDIDLHRDGKSNDLTITFDNPNDSILIKDQFWYTSQGFKNGSATNNRIESLMFSQGQGMSWIVVQNALLDKYTTDGEDQTYGFGTSDTINSSAGNDFLSGLDGGDTYRVELGTGFDTIYEDAQFINTDFIPEYAYYDIQGTDRIAFGEGIALEDVQFLRPTSSDDLLIKINDNDQITVKNQFYAFEGDIFGIIGLQWLDRIEEFEFVDGTTINWEDVLQLTLENARTDGDDAIYGFHYEDTLHGGAGDDFLSGGNDNDTYLYNAGDGNDMIRDDWDNLLSGGDDRILFGTGFSADDVIFSRDGNSDDLMITFANGETGSITIQNQFQAFHNVFGKMWVDRIEEIAFADNSETIITWEQIIETLLSQSKTSGDDAIYGFDREDTLDGGAGNDYLSGGNENDTYIFGLGYDQDTIFDDLNNVASGNFDIVQLTEGLTLNDLDFSRNDDGLIINIKGTSDQLTIQSQFHYGGLGAFNVIEEIHFFNGDILTLQDMRDILLTSTSGDDVLEGFQSNDTLDGGAGNDLLKGGDGDDTYIFDIGYDQDVIVDRINVANFSSNDVIQFGAGVTIDNISLEQVDNDLVISINGAEDTLTITDQFHQLSYYRIEQFIFADGTVWDLDDIAQALADDTPEGAIVGTDGDDVLEGTSEGEVVIGLAGDDDLDGKAGDDIYQYETGDGNDIIDEFYNSGFDTLYLKDLNAADVALSRLTGNTYDLTVTVNATGETITVDDQFYSGYGIEQVQFADGITWDREQIRENAWFRGTNGNDTLSGKDTDDTFFGGLGDDNIDSRSGSDTFVYRAGDGNDWINEENGSTSYIDTLSLVDLNADDVTLSRSGTDLLITVDATGHQIEVDEQFYSTSSYYGIERLEFADGTVWGRETLQENAWFRGTDGNDLLSGRTSDDTFFGGLGDDNIDSRSGNDTFIYRKGDGNDWINEENGSTTYIDTLSLLDLKVSDIVLSRSGTDLMVNVLQTGEQVEIDEQFYSSTYNYGIEQVQFADNTIWDRATIHANLWETGSNSAEQLTGTDSADRLFGAGGNDILTGGTGDDLLAGGLGNDTFVFNDASGHDQVFDFRTGDILELNSNTITDYDTVLANAYQSGAGTVITTSAESSITLTDVNISDLREDDFRFV